MHEDQRGIEGDQVEAGQDLRFMSACVHRQKLGRFDAKLGQDDVEAQERDFGADDILGQETA